MALPQPNRLKKKKDFEKVFKKGKGTKQGFLFFKALKNETGINRFGFIITKKSSKKAVIRNRIKRRLSEAVRENLSRLKKGWDGIFIVSQPLSRKEMNEIKETVVKIFEKNNLFQS